MSEPQDSTQVASSEPTLVKDETELVTHPKGGEEAAPATITDTAASTATTAASTAAAAATTAATVATNAAVGMKDNVFSMFGGGAKKERKEEDETAENDRSGSSKAKKDAEDDDVSIALSPLSYGLRLITRGD